MHYSPGGDALTGRRGAGHSDGNGRGFIMRRIIFITVLVFLFFMLQFLLFNLVGWWLRPQLLILLIIFFDLYLGVRYGLYTAVLAGLIMDSFAASVFGLNLVSFILDAYMTSLL